MIPQQHRQESLHRAYVTAVAAQAGIKAAFSAGTEYGVDGEFRRVTERVTVAGRRMLSEDGYPLDFQMKSTTGCRGLESKTNYFSFDCEVNAYNKLALQNRNQLIPVLLLILCLPHDERDWLHTTKDALTIRQACYWYYVNGAQSTRRRSQVIRIPRSQLFTPEALKDIMNEVQAKGKRHDRAAND